SGPVPAAAVLALSAAPSCRCELDGRRRLWRLFGLVPRDRRRSRLVTASTGPGTIDLSPPLHPDWLTKQTYKAPRAPRKFLLTRFAFLGVLGVLGALVVTTCSCPRVPSHESVQSPRSNVQSRDCEPLICDLDLGLRTLDLLE